MDLFDRVYVINLPERHDRRREIEQTLTAAGMPLTPGKIEIFPAIRPDAAAEFPSIGVRGCFLSHLAVLQQARQAGLNNVLVLEDDLQLSKIFKTEQVTLAQQLQAADWDLVYLGLSKPQTTTPIQLQTVPSTQPIMRTHFYGVHSRAFTPLIEFLELVQSRPAGHPSGGAMHLDGAYTTFRQQNPQVVTLLASPSLGWQRSSRSDLSPKWYESLPVLQQTTSALRSVKAQIDDWRLG